MSPRLLFNIIGATALCLGPFLPLVHVPILGDVNYFQNGKGDGAWVLGAGVVALALAGLPSPWFRLVILCGLLSFVIVTYDVLNFHEKMEDAKASLQREGGTNPGAKLGSAMLETVQIQYGVAVMALGAMALIASGVMSEPSNRAESRPTYRRSSSRAANRDAADALRNLGE